MSLSRHLGLQSPTSHQEKLAATAGAFLSIVAIGWISHHLTGLQGALAVLPSMGASAVLLFAVPHGALSQPWALVGGHLFSAAVGVTCAQWIDPTLLAGAAAVGLSIGLMQLLRCVHPPGGATALVAVIGGEAVRDLGYHYVVIPTLLNCLVMLACALVFNNLFHWRKYPSTLMRYQPAKAPDTQKITVSHIQQAMETLDEVVDIEAEQVKYILDKADEIMRADSVSKR